MLEPRTCPACGTEFQPRNRSQLYCNRACSSDPLNKLHELDDEALRDYMAGLIEWFCAGDPDKIAKLTAYFADPYTYPGGITLGEIIGPYQQQEFFITEGMLT